MSEKERSALIAKLMAAASVLGLSLGMTAQAADQQKTDQGQTVTQHKGETDQHKLESGFLKHESQGQTVNQHKGETGFLKHNTGGSSQIKHDTPSTELNPQPEPPKPTGADQTPKH